MLYRLIILITVSFLSVSYIYSQKIEPINPDRPDQSNSPSIVLINSFQFESGFIYQSHKFGLINNSYKIVDITMPDVLIRYGLFKNAEISVDVKYLEQKLSGDGFELGHYESKESGFGPITIGTKIKICEEKGDRPAIAFAFNLGIPQTGGKVFQTPYTALEFRLLMQNTISNTVSVSYNVGETWDGFSAKPTVLYNVSLGIAATERIGGFIEGYGYLADGGKPDHRVDAGLTYLIRNNLQADISAGVGLTSVSPDFFIGAGFSFRLPR